VQAADTPARMEKPELYEDDGQAPGESRDSPLLLERLHRALARRNFGDETGAWMREVLAPPRGGAPRPAPLIAEGALLWLRAAARCVRRCRSELGV